MYGKAQRIAGLLALACLCLLCALAGAEETGKLVFSLLAPYQSGRVTANFDLKLSEPLQGRYGDLVFIDGAAAFSLGVGGVVRAEDIPEGTAYTLNVSLPKGYVARYANSDGYRVITPRGRLAGEGVSGIVISAIGEGDAPSATYWADVTSLFEEEPDASSFTLPQEDVSRGTALTLARQGERWLAGPINLSPREFKEYGERGTVTRRYLIPAGGEKPIALEVEATLDPGDSLRATDDTLEATLSVYEGERELASRELAGAGVFSVDFERSGQRVAARVTSGGAELALAGSLLLVGRPLEAGEFSFSVLEGDTVVATAVNDAQGKLAFTPIHLTARDLGAHTYRVVQDAGEQFDIYYDDTEATVGAFVTADEDGALTVATTGYTLGGYKASGLRFENKYAVEDFKIYHLWQGGNEGDVELILYANGERIKKQPKPVIDGATYTFVDLPMFDEKGQRIVYSARELYVDGYMAMYVNTGAYAARTKMLYPGGTVINRRVEDFVFRVIWSGMDGAGPPEIRFTLYQNGVPYYVNTQPQRDEYGRYVYRHLPLKTGQDDSVYTVRAEALPGFLVSYDNAGADYAGRDAAYNGGTVVARRVPVTGETDHRGLYACFAAALAALIWSNAKIRRKPCKTDKIVVDFWQGLCYTSSSLTQRTDKRLLETPLRRLWKSYGKS